MSLKENDTYYETIQESREESITAMDIIKNWYLKRWISYREYLRLTDLIF